MVKSYREINQDALGREKSKKWYRKYRKAVLFALIAVILAMLAYSVAQNALSTAQTNNVFEIVVNNTDLGQTNGTKERIWRTAYYTNSSPIAISLLGHVVGTGAALEMNLNLTVNSTVIQDIDTMTNPGANIHDHASIYFIIPKGSNYSVDNSTGVSYLEWREYPILSGKNGTLAINQTVLSDLSSVNASLNYLNNSKVNKSNASELTGGMLVRDIMPQNVTYNDTTYINAEVNNAQTITTGAFIKVFFNKTNEDKLLEWSPTNSTFEPTSNGLYLISSTLNIDNTNGTNRFIFSAFINGTEAYRDSDVTFLYPHNTFNSFIMSTVFRVNRSEYVTLRLFAVNNNTLVHSTGISKVIIKRLD